MITGNQNRIVTLAGIDITDWVINLPTLPNEKPEWGSIPALPMLRIGVHSADGMFTPTNPLSILYQKRYDEMSLVVTQDGAVVWTGYLVDAPADLVYKRAELVGEPILQQKINRSARIDTTTTNPATAARNLLELHNVTIDPVSFGEAEMILDDIPVSIRVNPSVLNWTGTLGDLLRQLASAGVGRFYLLPSGSIGFDSWWLNEAPIVSMTIDDDDIAMQPEMSDDAMEPAGGYNVKYLYGTDSDSADENITTMDFSESSAVQVLTQQAAQYIGTQWVALSQRQYYRVRLPVDKAVGQLVTLQSYITVSSNLIPLSATCEVIGIDDGDAKWTTLTLRIDKGLL